MTPLNPTNPPPISANMNQPSIMDLGYLAAQQTELATLRKKVDRGKFWGKIAIILGLAGFVIPPLWICSGIALLLASFSAFY